MYDGEYVMGVCDGECAMGSVWWVCAVGSVRWGVCNGECVVGVCVMRVCDESVWWGPVDNPGPAHCIECAAKISTVMPVNNAYSWNPLR